MPFINKYSQFLEIVFSNFHQCLHNIVNFNNEMIYLQVFPYYLWPFQITTAITEVRCFTL